MRGLSSIISLFRNDFNFDNTGARMLNSIDHVTYNLLKNHIFGVITKTKMPYFTQRYNESLRYTLICKPLVIYRF